MLISNVSLALIGVESRPPPIGDLGFLRNPSYHTLRIILEKGRPSNPVVNDPDDAVVMSSANGLVGTGFASWYRLQPRAGFETPNG